MPFGVIDMPLDVRPKALRGKYGVYLSYFLADWCHIRLMGNILEEQDSWVAFPADPDTWLPLACLHIACWEANTEWYSKSAFNDRDDAWLFARQDAKERNRPTLHNEWFDPSDQKWHVSNIHPRAVA